MRCRKSARSGSGGGSGGKEEFGGRRRCEDRRLGGGKERNLGIYPVCKDLERLITYGGGCGSEEPRLSVGGATSRDN